jgi:hypothetical protein
MKMEGRVGDLIFYRRGNKTCCRSRPVYKPDSLSAASRQSAGEFGRASSAAKQFRRALGGLWPASHDGGMVNRLNTAFYSALRADERPRGQRVITPAALKAALQQFRFNNQAGLRFQVNCARRPHGQLQVSLPHNWVQLLKRPRYASHVQVQVAALALDAATGICRKTATVTDCVALGAVHNGVLPLLQLSAGAGLTTVIALQLRFIKEEANGAIYTSAEKVAMVSCIAAVLLPEKKPVARAAATPAAIPHTAASRAVTRGNTSRRAAPLPSSYNSAASLPAPQQRVTAAQRPSPAPRKKPRLLRKEGG